MHRREVSRPVGKLPQRQWHMQKVALPSIQRPRSNDCHARESGTNGVFALRFRSVEFRG